MGTLDAANMLIAAAGIVVAVGGRLAYKLLLDLFTRQSAIERQLSELTTRVAILEHDYEKRSIKR